MGRATTIGTSMEPHRNAAADQLNERMGYKQVVSNDGRHAIRRRGW